MRTRSSWIGFLGLLIGFAALCAQEPGPLPDVPTKAEAAAAPAAPAAEGQKGVEVLARGPIHEAFASLTAEPVAPKSMKKRPPKPLEELPPEQKPDGDVVWISGYWAYDDDRADYLWVSGVWRTAPPGKQWVAGYWRESGEEWQWVSGFWTVAAKEEKAQEVTYLPEPPKAPEVAPPGKAPTEDSFYVPGTYVWTGSSYAWRTGYWARVQPGYVWVSSHYRWTPAGFVFIPGYWDLTVRRRGILYAPVVITPGVVTVGFTYTPSYAVCDEVLVDSLFVRPAYCHYYFGDYYAVGYRGMGFESCVVYSNRHYDAIIVCERYERRRDPAWFSVQINLYNDRCAGRAPCPPRTLVQQTTVINNITNVKNVTNVTNVNNTTNVKNMTMIAPPAKVAAAKGGKLTTLDSTTRTQAAQQAKAVQQVAMQRTRAEVPPPAGAPKQARVASLSVPAAQPVKSGMVAPKAAPATAAAPARPAPARPATTPTNPQTPKSPTSPTRPGTTGPGVKPGVQPKGPPPRQPVKPPPPRRPPPKDSDRPQRP
jgi:hypothetical protein